MNTYQAKLNSIGSIGSRGLHKVDALIIGAGVVGLAIAKTLSEQLNNVLLIDKNNSYGEETSSRNSEVIHAGLYYPSASLKAKFCVAGKAMLYQYCQQRHIPHQRIGKLLVAQNQAELSTLQAIFQQAENNKVTDLTWLSAAELAQQCPPLKAEAAIHSPSTGIIDVHSYMQHLLTDFEDKQGLFVGQSEMLSAKQSEHGFRVKVVSQGETVEIETRYLINSGGLHSTQVARNISCLWPKHIPTLHWCRGHYFTYQGKSPFKQLIYPVPSHNGLGIHASLDVGGQLKFGPDTQYVDQLEYSVDEHLKDKFVRAIKQYFPEITADKLQPGYAGIRPKLQGPNEGFKDFVIQTESDHGLAGLVNLFGIDSPGLTSSLAIAKYVAQQLKGKINAP